MAVVMAVEKLAARRRLTPTQWPATKPPHFLSEAKFSTLLLPVQ